MGGRDIREGARLVRSYSLDTQSSALGHQGLNSAGHGGEKGVVGTVIMLVGC